MGIPPKEEYEQLIYGLAENPHVTNSTLSLYTISALAGIVEGSLYFDNGLELRVVEALDFKNNRIQRYGYEVYRGDDKLRWYDAQPHPDDASLQPTFPHHYHQDPDIKHHRLPAPGISFTAPNLPTLIADCIALGQSA